MLIGCALFVAAATAAQSAGNPAEALERPSLLLTNIQQVVSLSAEALQLDRYEAVVRGVVIYVSPFTPRIYVQDGTNGLQVNFSRAPEGFQAGQWVEAAGTVLAGQPAPRLVGSKAKVLGQGSLPEAPSVRASSLNAGEEFFRFATVRGVVRDMVAERNFLTLLLTEQAWYFEAVVPYAGGPMPVEWMDAELEVRGMSYPFFNGRGQSTGFKFHAPSADMVRVLSPGPGGSNQFDRPLLTIAEASRLPQHWQRRVRIAGTVTVHRPGAEIFLDDGTGVMAVSLLNLITPPSEGQSLDHQRPTWLRPGQQIEVIGVRQNWYSLAPMLIYAEMRQMGEGRPVAPVEVSSADLQAGRYPGRLVTVTARLLDARGWFLNTMRYESLVLQSGEDVFQARWESEVPAKWLLKPNSYVRVTGVNHAETGQFTNRSTFQLLLRSPADVVPAPAPPFWARREFRRVSAGAGAVGAIAAAWILFQRWQMRRLEDRVGDRTAALRDINARLQNEVAAREEAQQELSIALAAEKEVNQLKSSFVSMVSHEFRTPLEVILSSSNILDRYLERLSPDKLKAQLRSIRKSVGRMNDLIEDVLLLGKFDAAGLNCHPVPLDLVAFCRRAICEIESAAAREGAIQLQAEAMGGDATADESLLHHILTNLLSNALKYSPPERPVVLSLSRHGPDAEFVVRDEGCGIPAADQARLFTAFYRGSNVGQTPGSGLGLVIVKRCLDLHGGAIRCESAPGQGTTFTFTLPLFDGTRHFRRKAVPDQTSPPSPFP
jgi:signal transduction histidine kinase